MESDTSVSDRDGMARSDRLALGVDELDRCRQRVEALEAEVSTVRDRTRRELGRWLHDDLAQLLVGLRLELARLESDDGAHDGDGVRRSSELALRAATVLRDRITEMMGGPAPAGDLDVDAAFAAIVEVFTDQSGIACQIETDGARTSVSADVAVALICSVRELLVNVGRHSHALHARIVVEHVDGVLSVTVSDDGSGFDHDPRAMRDPEHVGLVIIADRLAEIGGHLTTTSAPDAGNHHRHDGAVRRGVRAMSEVRVVLVDDHEVVRAGIRMLLMDQPDIVVVAEAADGAAAIDVVSRHRPDVVVMDVSMPTLNGIEATRRIVADTPGVSVLCLSIHGDGHLVSEMLQAGASGYILKDSSPAEIIAAVRAIAARKTYLSAAVSDYIVRDYVAARQANRVDAPQLTHREYDVLQMIAEGHDTAGIARLLSISGKTVSTHRGHIMQKLGLDNVVALTKYAIRHGISSAEPDTSESFVGAR